jgi:hypothetical protein
MGASAANQRKQTDYTKVKLNTKQSARVIRAVLSAEINDRYYFCTSAFDLLKSVPLGALGHAAREQRAPAARAARGRRCAHAANAREAGVRRIARRKQSGGGDQFVLICCGRRCRAGAGDGGGARISCRFVCRRSGRAVAGMLVPLIAHHHQTFLIIVVQVEVDAVLLDHKHLTAQPQRRVERARRNSVERLDRPVQTVMRCQCSVGMGCCARGCRGRGAMRHVHSQTVSQVHA